MILVDSSVWVDHFRGVETPQSAWLARALAEGQPKLLTGDLILAEVLQGFRSVARANAAIGAFDALECVELGGRRRAIQAAATYRLLRAKGVTVRSTIDCLIASFCIEEGIPLLHSDRDFDPYARHRGLKVVPLR